MSRSIKLSDLRRADACAEQVKLFKELFPRGATFETEAEAVAAALSVADRFNWSWAARNLLSLAAEEAYEDAAISAWKVLEAYITATQPASAALEAAEAEAFARAWWNDNDSAG